MASFVRRAALISCGSVVALSVSTMASAQDTGSTAADSEHSGIADIIVTAEKRSTRIQDTPIAMHAIDGVEVAKAGITDIRSIERLAPDVTISTDSSNTKMSIRGVSASDNNETADPAVAVSIDGEYINRPKALSAAFFDLDRIEVLRGPQGTLYGRNSTAGAITIIAAKPKLGVTEGSVMLGYGNYDAKTAQAMINVPIGDKVALRVAGSHVDHDGYRNNAPAGRGETQNQEAVRASVAAEPNDWLNLYLAGEFVDVDQTNQSRYTIPVNASTPGVVDPNPSTPIIEGGGVPSEVRIPSDANFNSFPLDTLGFVKSRQYAVRGKVEADLGFATLSYIGAYRAVDNKEQQNLNGFPTTLTYNTPKANIRTQNHELRLNGETSGVIWQTGLFYFHETQDIVAYAYGDARYSPPNGRFLNYFYRPDLDSKSYAAFGQATVPIVEDVVSITAGARYTMDRKKGTLINFPAKNGDVGYAIDDPGATRLDRKARSNMLTWNVGVDWHPGVDNLIYAKVSKGYKAGGFDNVGEFKPEELVAYEIGSKNQFFDRALQFNAAAFYYDYTNQQVSALIDVNIGNQIFNAGKSRIWGLEGELVAQPSDFDQLSLTVDYLNAKYTDFPASLPSINGSVTDLDAVTPGIQTPNLAGNIPRFSPKWMIAVGYDKTIEIGDSKITANISRRYRSTYFVNSLNWASMKVKGYGQTDASIEYSAPGDRFTLRAYVRNLENKSIPSAVEYNGGGIGVIGIYLQPPRTYGLQAGYKF